MSASLDWTDSEAFTQDGYRADVSWNAMGRAWIGRVRSVGLMSRTGHKTEQAARAWCAAEIEVFRRARASVTRFNDAK